MKVANFFIRDGSLAETVGRGNKMLKTFPADPKEALFDGPASVIIDHGTVAGNEPEIGLALQEALGRTPTDAETADHLGLDQAAVRQAREDVSRAAQLERSTGDFDGTDVAERADGAEGGPLAALLDAELRGYLIDAVAALPERLRTIVVAHFFDGREMQEIAVELGVTASRVSQLCGRAVSLLRDGLNAQLDPERVEDLDETTSRVGRRKHAYYQLVADSSTVGDRLARGRALIEPAAPLASVEPIAPAAAVAVAACAA